MVSVVRWRAREVDDDSSGGGGGAPVGHRVAGGSGTRGEEGREIGVGFVVAVWKEVSESEEDDDAAERGRLGGV